MRKLPDMRCVLLIDDHAIMLDGLRMVLEAAIPQARILTAGAINAALQVADDEPDVILLDIKLSGINGLDGIGLLKRKWPRARIAMLSSQDDIETREQAIARGAHIFVSKIEAAERIVGIVKQLGAGELVAITAQAKPLAQYLTPRQCEVLELLSTGLTNKAIARQLNLSDNTVRRHLQDIFSYFNVATRTEAIFAARSQGIVS